MSKSLYTLSKPSIEYLCGLIRELSKVSEGIDDLNLRSDSTFSSLKINTLLDVLKQDCNDYTDRLVTNLSRLELKLVTDETDITDSNIMYLYKPDGATSYNQYVVIEGNKVLLGICDIDMADYYTITETDNKFALKTTTDTLTTELVTHKNNTDIHTSADEKASYVKKTVADVGKTLITFPDSTNHKVVTSDETYYIVKNDICYVHLAFGCVLRNATTTIIGLPLPLSNTNVYAPQAVPYDYADLTSIRVRVSVDSYGILKLVGGTAGISYICSFSYPVAES